MFYCGIPVTALVPLFLRWYGRINSYYWDSYWLQTVVLFISGVFVVILVFVIAGLFSKVLAGVFEQAVSYKQENDLTI